MKKVLLFIVILCVNWSDGRSFHPPTRNVILEENQGCVAGYKWVQTSQNLTGSVEGDNFVSSFSYSDDGEMLAIGADLGFGSGYVQVFKHKRGTGGLLEQLGDLIIGESYGDKFGSSVALSADGFTLVVGAIHSTVTGYQGGSVQVYAYDDIDSLWHQKGQTLGSDVKKELAGSSVSISDDGNIIAISYPKADKDLTAKGEKTGRVRMYQYNSTNEEWSQLGNDIHGEKSFDKLGDKVTLSSDGMIVAAGSRENSQSLPNAGHVQIHEYDVSTNTWIQMGEDIDGENENDFTGGIISISSDGETIAIGSPWNDEVGFRSGHVRVFSFNRTTSTWDQLGADIDGNTGDNVGSSVSLSGDGSVVAFAQTDTGNETLVDLEQIARVLVYTYDVVTETWSPLGEDSLNEVVNEYRGRALSVELSADGLRMAVGSSDEEDATGGLCRIYDSRECTDPPTSYPSVVPSAFPSKSMNPTVEGTLSRHPSFQPSLEPSLHPTTSPTISSEPTVAPLPTSYPSMSPQSASIKPSISKLPSSLPSLQPSDSFLPTFGPSISHQPSDHPTVSPTGPPGGVFSWKIEHLLTRRYYSGDASDNIVLVSNYNLSNHYHELHIFENDCETAASAIPIVDSIPSDGFGFKEVEITFDINETVVESSTLWTATSEGGSLEFCLLIELYWNKEKDYRLNFQEIIYRMDIRTVVGIDLLSFNAFRADTIDRSVPDVDYSSYVRAYQCNQEFEEQVSPLDFNEGSAFTICVESTKEFLIQEFQDLEISQNAYGSYAKGESLTAISDGNKISEEVDVSCDEVENVCYSNIRLGSRFFKSTGPPPISISGSIRMRRSRRLQSSSGPAMSNAIIGELDEEPKVGDFQIWIELQSVTPLQTTSGFDQDLSMNAGIFTRVSMIALISGFLSHCMHNS